MPRTKKTLKPAPKQKARSSLAIAQAAAQQWVDAIMFTRHALNPGNTYLKDFDPVFEAVSHAVIREWIEGGQDPQPDHDAAVAMQHQIQAGLSPDLKKVFLDLDAYFGNEADVAREAGYIIGLQIGLRLRGAR